MTVRVGRGARVASVEQAVIREPGADTPREFRLRVQRLAVAYLALFVGAVAGLLLLVWQARLLVALSQRSNVETLVLAFVFVFFAYVVVLSAPGAWGALRIGALELQGRLGDSQAVERRKMACYAARGQREAAAALNYQVEVEQAPCQPIVLPVADEVGSLGELVIDGARLVHRGGWGSNALLAYFVHQVNAVLGERVGDDFLDIVDWQILDDESTRQYLALARFARNLERHLGATELWPKLRLTAADCAELVDRLRAICPALRDEALLPDWEYAAEHKLPLIPEPLGLVSLQRSERRADPLASMGCAVLVVLALLVVLGVLIVFPPWVPGT